MTKNRGRVRRAGERPPRNQPQSVEEFNEKYGFWTDNPYGPDWVGDSYTFTAGFGLVGELPNTSYDESGKGTLWLDPVKLNALAGENGERSADWNALDWAQQSIESNKERIRANGNKWPEDMGSVFIVTQPDGTSLVNEGNKRLAAAAALGVKRIPVHWRAFGGGENRWRHPFYYQ